ncbi:MAG: hypothetical protein LUC40_02415, partial [Oscillospiraceae bacterium]|nr:hypothetical protein [Oscillospiraceae bacterium]
MTEMGAWNAQDWIGRVGEEACEVSAERTAEAMGSGSLPVFATPAMIALMEGAACKALEGVLPEGVTSVGVSLEVAHTSATARGAAVSARAELCAANGRELTF